MVDQWPAYDVAWPLVKLTAHEEEKGMLILARCVLFLLTERALHPDTRKSKSTSNIAYVRTKKKKRETPAARGGNQSYTAK